MICPTCESSMPCASWMDSTHHLDHAQDNCFPLTCSICKREWEEASRVYRTLQRVLETSA